MPQRDYYAVLGIAKDAGLKAIKDAFRPLAMKYHPDRNKEPGVSDRFKEVAEAYAVLSDPKKRSKYDAYGFPGVAAFSEQDLFGGINFDELISGRQALKVPKRGTNIEVSIIVSLEQVAHGGEETVRLSHPATCPACQGKGGQGGTAARRCHVCNGSGLITESQLGVDPHFVTQLISPCTTCLGCGSIIDRPCAECRGTGQIELEETLTVNIPPGIAEDRVLRIAGKGMPSPDAGGNAGDLLVVVHTRHDPRFERSGADLVRRETIALTDAVLGATWQVPALEGPASVHIPPGTQSGTVLRLKDKGLPEFGSDRRGDLFLHLMVQMPEKLSQKERKLYERLRALEKTGSERMRKQLREESGVRGNCG
ncbi:DnaJ C-terminal domain-containing protein [Propionivibrio sp.]|uniref:DnaJ C-terminal domain-containing protein n=1 Tax=Propionivibrio sp. TaxID=2212460 RepID=UPI003BF35B9F